MIFVGSTFVVVFLPGIFFSVRCCFWVLFNYPPTAGSLGSMGPEIGDEGVVCGSLGQLSGKVPENSRFSCWGYHLWMDEIQFAPLESIVDTTTFVGICVGDSSFICRGIESFRWVP